VSPPAKPGDYLIYLGPNTLAGTLPSLSGLTALQTFSVSYNQLTGTIPAPPASLPAGQGYLCGNSLSSSGDPAIDAAWGTATGGNWLACQIGYAPPACTLTAVPSSISAGGSSILKASCSPTATSYAWTEDTCVWISPPPPGMTGCACAGNTTDTCTVTPASTTTYTPAAPPWFSPQHPHRMQTALSLAGAEHAPALDHAS